MLQKIKAVPKFLSEVREELRKVNWSTRQELTGAAVLVVIVAVILTAYIALIDLALSRSIHMFLKY
jgi:preprotein translocase SecE subunit